MRSVLDLQINTYGCDGCDLPVGVCVCVRQTAEEDAKRSIQELIRPVGASPCAPRQGTVVAEGPAVSPRSQSDLLLDGRQLGTPLV